MSLIMEMTIELNSTDNAVSTINIEIEKMTMTMDLLTPLIKKCHKVTNSIDVIVEVKKDTSKISEL